MKKKRLNKQLPQVSEKSANPFAWLGLILASLAIIVELLGNRKNR